MWLSRRDDIFLPRDGNIVLPRDGNMALSRDGNMVMSRDGDMVPVITASLIYPVVVYAAYGQPEKLQIPDQKPAKKSSNHWTDNFQNINTITGCIVTVAYSMSCVLSKSKQLCKTKIMNIYQYIRLPKQLPIIRLELLRIIAQLELLRVIALNSIGQLQYIIINLTVTLIWNYFLNTN